MKMGIAAAALAAVLAVLGLACSSTGGLDLNTDNRCDYLVLPGITDGSPFRNWTERDCPVSLTLPMSVIVDFIQQGGGVSPTDPGTQLSTFVLDKYVVSYRNITQNGANVPRTSVPETFVFTPAAVVGDGGSFPATYELIGGPILQRSAKGQPPLNSDSFYTIGTDPLSGVVLEAEIVWWGHPVSQPSRECRGTMVFRFTIFDAFDGSDNETALCEQELGF